MNYPKISIVTPSFNQGEYLEKTILSVINQNYPNIEYILIDGGSTDGSVDIIKAYEKYLSYWISEKDQGQSDALNKGFKVAAGEIFAYLNSDDLYLPDTLITIAESFISSPEADIIYGHSNIINDADKILTKCIALPFRLKEHLNGVFSIPQQSSFWRRRVYDELGGFNVNNHTCMDGEFFAYAGSRNYQFHRLNKVLSSFRIHSKSKTGDMTSSLKLNFPKDELKFISDISRKFNIPVSKSLTYWYRLKYYPLKAFYKLNISKTK